MVCKFQEYGQQCITFEQFNILNNLISLWQRYVMWSRALFLAGIERSANLPAVQSRVYQAPIDFYNTLRVFYGERLAEQFLNAFLAYTVAKINLMNAMIGNSQDAVNASAQELYTRADVIAALLSQIPYWREDYWKTLLYQDISMGIAEFRAALTGDHEMEISIFERMLLNAADIGGYMASAIFQSTQQPVPGKM